jgi:hypothetical protein
MKGTIRAWLYELAELACGLFGLACIAGLLYLAPAILASIG